MKNKVFISLIALLLPAIVFAQGDRHGGRSASVQTAVLTVDARSAIAFNLTNDWVTVTKTNDTLEMKSRNGSIIQSKLIESADSSLILSQYWQKKFPKKKSFPVEYNGVKGLRFDQQSPTQKKSLIVFKSGKDKVIEVRGLLKKVSNDVSEGNKILETFHQTRLCEGDFLWPPYQDSAGPLITDICKNNGASVEALLAAGANPKERADSAAAIDFAVSEGQLNTVKFLLAKGEDVNVLAWSDNYTPLMFASEFNQFEIAKYLISMKANLDYHYVSDYRTEDTTALLVACRTQSFAIANLLIDSGADVKIGRPMLELSLSNSPDAVPLAERMIAKGAILTNTLNNAIRGDAFEIGKRLLAAGVSPDEGEDASTLPNIALVHAILEDHFDFVTLLVNAGADVNSLHDTEFTPLQAAAYKQSKPITDLLLVHHANPSFKNIWTDRSPLALAAAANNVGILKSLLAAGADLNQTGRYNGQVRVDGSDSLITPIGSAVENNALDALKYLIQRKADVNLGQPMFYVKSAEAVDLLANAGCDLKTWDYVVEIAEGALDHRFEILEALAAHHANLEAVDGNLGRTALMWATQDGDDTDYELAVLMIKLGANVNARWSDGKTILGEMRSGGSYQQAQHYDKKIALIIGHGGHE